MTGYRRFSPIVSTPNGQGVVVDTNVIKGMVRVKLDKEGVISYQIFSIEDIKIIKDAEIKIDENIIKELKKLTLDVVIKPYHLN